MASRFRRSCLFVPADNSRALAKARSVAADALILDLEDAVAPERKADARAAAAAFVRETQSPDGPELAVRVNALTTEHGRPDLTEMGGLGVALLLPKVDDERAVAEARALAPDASVWAMAETARGLMNLREIVRAMAPGAALVVGSNDLAKDLRSQASPGRAELVPHLAAIVACARAAGLSPLDGVFNALDDAPGLAAECAQGRALGFDGKTLIHPAQIEAANRAFAPSERELAEARAIVAAFEDPANSGKGVLRVNGQMTERLHLEQARDLLAAAARLGMV